MGGAFCRCPQDDGRGCGPSYPPSSSRRGTSGADVVPLRFRAHGGNGFRIALSLCRRPLEADRTAWESRFADAGSMAVGAVAPPTRSSPSRRGHQRPTSHSCASARTAATVSGSPSAFAGGRLRPTALCRTRRCAMPAGGRPWPRPAYLAAIAASISSALRARPSLSSSWPSAVIATSSSMRMPMPRQRSGTSRSSRGM